MTTNGHEPYHLTDSNFSLKALKCHHLEGKNKPKINNK